MGSPAGRRALVIGMSGLLGGALVRALEGAGFDVTGTVHRQHTPHARPLDVRDRDDVFGAVGAVRPDVVFLAVNVPGGVDACEDQPDLGDTILVQGTRHVAEAVAAHGAILVHYSTDYIFDGRAGPYGEECVPNPLSHYGRAKWEAEECVRAALDRHLIVRTTWVYGWDRTSRNFAMQVWQRVQTGDPMRVPADQVANPTLADYIAEASLRLLELGVTGVVNVVGRDRISRDEFARSLARAMALDAGLIVPVSTAELGQKAARPLQGGLRTGKLQRLLGTEPLDLPEALKRFRRHWRADTYVVPGPARTGSEAGRLKQEILERVRAYHDLVHRPKPFVPYRSRVHYAGRVYGAEEMVNLVDAALDFWLTLGPYGDLLEARLKRFLGARDVVLVNSGSSANLTAILTLMSRQFDRPLQPGDEILTVAATFPTTLAPIVITGLTPVFVDVQLGTYNADPVCLAEAVSERTRAIVLPHTLGNPFDLEAICALARQHELLLVEDACDALGSEWQGRPVGTFGDLATLSFFPAHQITTGEGGAVVVNNPRFSRIARSVRDWGRDCWCAPGESNSCGRRFGWTLGELPHGYDHKFTYTNVGFNFKPTDLQAAVGVAQVEWLETFVEKRRRNFRLLYEGLRNWEDRLILPRWDPRAAPAWFGFPLTTREEVSSTALIQHLENANIETRRIFGGNILKQPGYSHIPRRVHGSLDNTNRVMRDTFFIGVYPGLTDEMIGFVLEVFRQFFQGRP